MTQLRVLTAVCLLLVLVGSSAAFAVADNPQQPVDTSKQTAVLGPQTGSVELQVMPEEHSVLRDQPMTFAVRVVSDGEEGLLLGFHINPETAAKFEVHNPDAKEVSVPLVYPDYDAVFYIPEEKVGAEEYVPVTVSPEEKYPLGGSTVEVTRISRDLPSMLTAEVTFGIRCPVGCRVELMIDWIGGNIGRIVAILGLLVTFFGRKKIWAALHLPTKHKTGASNGEQQPDAETVGTNNPDES